MRLSDLLRSEVFDVNGRRVGRVHDVRLVRDGPPLGAFGPTYRVDGLIVGFGSIGSRLGFDRANVHGPWPLKAFFRHFHRNTKLVEWSVIERIGDGRVEVSVPAEDLPGVPALR